MSASATNLATKSASIADFHEQGYLLLRGALTPDNVEIILASVHQMVKEAVKNNLVLREPYYHEGSFKLVRVLRRTLVLDQLIDHPSYFGYLLALLGSHLQLMGVEVFVRGTADVAITGFHTDLGVALQQILPSENGPYLQIKAQLFLTDLSQPDSSNFALVPQSHRQRVRESDELCQIPQINRHLGLNGELPSEAVQLLARPGDVLLFPHTLWHGVACNRSGRTRYSVTLRYGQLALRPLERFDPVLTDPRRTLSARQRRLLGELGEGFPSPYRPPDQDRIMLGEKRCTPDR